ncbi:DUF3866 family protein [Natranaerobius trueperi]|uniref:DUF3866 domain-containing protein n=1 Tax=Natranaerobius trueperi TaxID=759412 RepID=A0A226C072_9FIRM|nr:DUF3866 family protein [Natranaerobius trueperi]OWZ83994.1 hypothetical protein CDO51_05390 [Natranaerobius trueperi]
MKLSITEAVVSEVIKFQDQFQDLYVKELGTDNNIRKARLYYRFCNPAMQGDKVLLNVTAEELNLGTGGLDFVITNLSKQNVRYNSSGHIMKLRYTPLQFAVESLEEKKEYQISESQFRDLNKLPVVVGELHSMLVPFILAVNHFNSSYKIVYIMTDEAALPMELSRNIQQLQQKKLINSTISIRNSFGGDYEAVNIFSALIYAYSELKADLVVVTMGPGIVGTCSTYGFSGLEQVFTLMAASKLRGSTFFIPRISFSDSRKRHTGISHHTLSVLRLADPGVQVCFPILDDDKNKYIINQMSDHLECFNKHKISWLDPKNCESLYNNSELPIKTMGRSFREDKSYFESVFVTAKKITIF